MNFQNFLKKARKVKKLSRHKLANQLKLHPATIYRYESGQRPIPADTLAKIADTLNCDIAFVKR